MSTLAIAAKLRRGDFELDVRETIELLNVTAIFGRSGSGKTSLLRLIAGLERASEGSIELDGLALQGAGTWLAPHRRRIGYVFQDTRLFSHLSVRGNIEFAQRKALAGPAPALDDVVSALQLEPLLAKNVDDISGGERQRVAIARSVMAGPRLLLMDEPLSSLDIDRKRQLIPFIEQLPEKFGVPVVYVTHDPDEVTRLAGHVLILEDGRVAMRGRPAEVFSALDPAAAEDRYEIGSILTGRLISHANGLTKLAIGDQAMHVPGTIGQAGGQVHLRVRARDVVIATERPPKLSIRNVLEAELVSMRHSSETNTELGLLIGGQTLRARITRDAAADLGLKPPQAVFALIKTVALDGVL